MNTQINTQKKENIAFKELDAKAVLDLARKIYENNFYAVWAREVLQNSVDALSKNVRIQNELVKIIEENARTKEDEEKMITKLTVQDDGCGMTEDVIRNAFLALGGSSKVSDTAVGGFGIAKVIVMNGDCKGPSPFGKDVYWFVETTAEENGELKTYYFDSEMLDKEPLKELEPKEKVGTIITVYRQKRCFQRDITHVLENSNVAANLFYNDIKMTQLKYARKVKDITPLDWCDVYYKPNNILSHQRNYAIVRIGGVYQFTRYVSDRMHGTAVVEIKSKYKPSEDGYPLTPNREQIKSEFNYRNELDGILSTLNTPDIIEDEEEPYVFETIFNANFSPELEKDINFETKTKRAREIKLFGLSEEEVKEQKVWESENDFYEERKAEKERKKKDGEEFMSELERYEAKKRDEENRQRLQLKKAQQSFHDWNQSHPSLFTGFRSHINKRTEINSHKELDVNIESISVRRNRSFKKKPDLYSEKNLKRLYCFKVFIEMIFEAAGESMYRFPYRVGWVLEEGTDACYYYKDGERYILFNPVGVKTSQTYIYEFVSRTTQILVHELCHETHRYHDGAFTRKFHHIMNKAVNPYFMEYVKVARKILH